MKSNRYVVSVVIGTMVNMKQVHGFTDWLVKNAKANMDVVLSGNPIRVRKLGRVVAGLNTPGRLIGCNMKNDDVFKYTHHDEHPCVWSISHSDVVVTIGDDFITSTAKEVASVSNRLCYNYGNEFTSTAGGHYAKEEIMRSDIVTTNEAKAIKEDILAAAKAELDAAKKAYEVAKAKYNELVAKNQAAVSADPKDYDSVSIAQERESILSDTGKELLDGPMVAAVQPEVHADFTFNGKGYCVAVKDAFDVEIFNSLDTETQQQIIEESSKAGHIVAA